MRGREGVSGRWDTQGGTAAHTFTFFTLGTSRPWGVSMATPMLCAARYTTWVASVSHVALSMGKEESAKDVACSRQQVQ